MKKSKKKEKTIKIKPRKVESKKEKNKTVVSAEIAPMFREKYEKMQCKFMKKNGKQCKCYAAGKSTLCKKHGGKSTIPSNLIPAGQITDTHLKLTKFNPSVHPLEYINLARQGLSRIEIAAHFEVSVITLTKWEQTYKEMNIAVEIGDALVKSWWMNQGKEALEDNRYNNTMFKFLTGNTFGWSDKIEQTNMNMNVHGVLVAPDKMSPSEWEEKAKEQIKEQDAIDAEFFDVD
jgi:DNA-binding transcriptional regulator YiaG